MKKNRIIFTIFLLICYCNIANLLSQVKETVYDTDKYPFTGFIANADTIITVHELGEVNVINSVGLINMRTPIIQTQKITSCELAKAACCNLRESFTTNPSVDVSYSDAATGSKQIKLLGLSGKYVQLLTENYPNLRGLASTYGLNYIPGPWMESILLSKGSSSVLNGYESITGQINIEYKKPLTSEKLALNLFASDEGRFEANLTSGLTVNPYLSTAILAHAENTTTEIDHNGDGFLDQPKVKQYQLFNRWDFNKDFYHGRIGVKALHEERNSGQTKKATPNPYKIGINTDRYEFFMKNGFILDAEKERSIGIITSGSLHEQDAAYGSKMYIARQTNLYANFIFATRFNEQHKLSTGFSLNSDLYNEEWKIGVAPSQNLKREEVVPGLFGEYTLNFHEHLTIMLGLRGDWHNKFEFFATPRLHIKYNPVDYFNLRASAGKGTRTPYILAENSFLLAGNRNIRNIELLKDLKQETAWNYGLNLSFYIPVKEKELTLNTEWYYTNFTNQVVTDMDSDPHVISFYNLDGRSYSNSMQFEASYEILRNWTMTLAHRLMDVKTTIGGVLREKPLTSRYKSLLTTSYQTPLRKWQFDFTAQLNGGGRMPDPDKTTPLWEKEFKPFPLLQCQITKNFRNWSVYAGSENLTGYVQKHPVISADNVNSPDFDASMVWGPMMGRMAYVGFRWFIYE